MCLLHQISLEVIEYKRQIMRTEKMGRNERARYDKMLQLKNKAQKKSETAPLTSTLKEETAKKKEAKGDEEEATAHAPHRKANREKKEEDGQGTGLEDSTYPEDMDVCEMPELLTLDGKKYEGKTNGSYQDATTQHAPLTQSISLPSEINCKHQEPSTYERKEKLAFDEKRKGKIASAAQKKEAEMCRKIFDGKSSDRSMMKQTFASKAEQEPTGMCNFGNSADETVSNLTSLTKASEPEKLAFDEKRKGKFASAAMKEEAEMYRKMFNGKSSDRSMMKQTLASKAEQEPTGMCNFGSIAESSDEHRKAKISEVHNNMRTFTSDSADATVSKLTSLTKASEPEKRAFAEKRKGKIASAAKKEEAEMCRKMFDGKSSARSMMKQTFASKAESTTRHPSAKEKQKRAAAQEGKEKIEREKADMQKVMRAEAIAKELVEQEDKEDRARKKKADQELNKKVCVCVCVCVCVYMCV